MKKIVLSTVVILLCSFAIKRIAFTPISRLMLTADAIVAAKVISHDTTAIKVELTKVLFINDKTTLVKGQLIKINHGNNPKYKIKSARIADNATAIFYLNTVSKSENYNPTDRFSGIVAIQADGKVPFVADPDKEEAATLMQYAKAIKQIKATYTIDKTGVIKSKWNKEYIYKNNKMSSFAKSIFDEVERERSGYRK